MMKKILFGIAGLAAVGFAPPASAADLAARPYTKAPPMIAAVAVYDWTGFYIGINGGGGWSGNRDNRVSETFAGAPFASVALPGGTGTFGNRNASGGFGGGQIGYNWQAQNFVFGLETDIQGSGIRGSAGATLIPYIGAGSSITAVSTERLDWFGTVRGRLGYAWNNVLLYGTGGFAYGQVRSSLAMTDTLGFSAATTGSSTRTGYVVGGGAEYGFAPNWTAKIEYQYLNLGRGTLNATEILAGAPTAFAVSNSTRFDYHTVRAGLNYKWGGPVVARY